MKSDILPSHRIISDLQECKHDEKLGGVYLQVAGRRGQPRPQLDGLVAIRTGPFCGAVFRVQVTPSEGEGGEEGEEQGEVVFERPPRLTLCSPAAGAAYMVHPCVDKDTGLIRGLPQALQGVPWRMALVGRFIKKIFVEPTFAFELFESAQACGNPDAWNMLLNDPATFTERARAASLASVDAAVAYSGDTSLILRESNPAEVAALVQHAKKLSAPPTSAKAAAVAWFKGFTRTIFE